MSTTGELYGAVSVLRQILSELGIANIEFADEYDKERFLRSMEEHGRAVREFSERPRLGPFSERINPAPCKCAEPTNWPPVWVKSDAPSWQGL